MDTLIKDTTQAKPNVRRTNAEKDKEIQSLLSSHRTRIKVVGCGGAGNNTLSRLVEVGVGGVVAIAVNTDAQDLLYAQADEKILIGRDITNGLGAGSNPEIGEQSAHESAEEIKQYLKDSDLVFVTCGLGGGTGTGSAPVVAEIARGLGALTISVVTLPFTEEGVMRWENARLGLERLQQNSDTVIVVQNDKLLDIVPDLPLNQAFKVSDEILVNAVKGITELVTEKGLVNLDFADVCAVMKNGGTAMIGLGESDSENKAANAVEMAVRNPLLDLDITGAKAALINITGGNNMSLKDARSVMKSVAEKLDPAARVIWGARMDPNMDKAVRVMLIVTGLRGGTRSEKAAVLHNSAKHEAPRTKPELLPAFDIELRAQEQDLPTASAVDTGSRSAKSENPKETKTKNRPVFNKIFEEETEADLGILQEAILALAQNKDNTAALRDIKNAATALNNSAQLFAFAHISYLAEALEALVVSLINGNLEITSEIIEMLKDVAVVFQGMVYNDDEAIAEAKKIVGNINLLLGNGDPHAQQSEANSEAEADFGEPRISEDSDMVEIGTDGIEIEANKKGKVSEMVNYVRQLLGEDGDEIED